MSLSLFFPFVWKSLLIAGGALGGIALMRRAAARDRALLLQGAVALLLALPAISWLTPVELARPSAVIPVEQAPAEMLAQYGDTPVSRALVAAEQAPMLSSTPLEAWDWVTILMLVYGAGVMILVARLSMGMGLLRRWTHRARPLESDAWEVAMAAHDPAGRTRLCISADTPAPLSWGIRRPVILIDPASAARPADAMAIIAHEQAHIDRRDWATLIASRLARALFWFNPLVWMLDRALVQQCEEAADACALRDCSAPDYAAALIACLGRSGRRTVPANSMAAEHGLGRRVRQVLQADATLIARRSRLALAAMVAALGFVVPAMAVRFVEGAGTEASASGEGEHVHVRSYVDAKGRHVTETTIIRDGRRTTAVSYGGRDPAMPEAPVPPMVPVAPHATTTSAPVDRAPALDGSTADRAWLPPVPPAPPVPPPTVMRTSTKASIYDAERAAANADIAAGRAVVAAQDAAEIASRAGADTDRTGSRAIAITAIGARARAIADHANAIAASAVSRALAPDSHYKAPLRAMGFSEDDADSLTAVGVTPAYVRDMRAAGYARISADELSDLRVLGVPPAYVRKAAAKRGGKLPSPDALGEAYVTGQD